MPADRSSKRSRVSRACDQCRTAREKCNGAQPSCLTCNTTSRACTYTTAPKKRGIQPGYIRTLELALTWLFQSTDCEKTLHHKLAQEGSSSIFFSKDSVESNRLHRAWRKSRFCRTIDKVLSGESIGSPESQDLANDEDDSDADETFGHASTEVDSNLRRVVTPQRAEASTAPAGLSGFRSPGLTLDLTPRPQDPGSTSNPSVLPANCWRLLEIYFAYTQAWLPMCEKSELLRLFYHFSAQRSSGSTSCPEDAGGYAELWSAVTVAAHQARHDTRAPRHALELDRLYTTARNLIPDETSSFSSGHVKALLNLSLLHIGRARFNAAWLLIGTAGRALIIAEAGSPKSSPRWQHIRAACFLLDAFLRLLLSGQPCLPGTGISRIEVSGLEEWQPWVDPMQELPADACNTPGLALSTFNEVVDVMRAVTEVDLSLATSLPSASQRLWSQLQLWKSSLSTDHDHVVNDGKPTPLTPPATLLRCTYLYALMQSSASSEAGYQLLDLLERYCDQNGAFALPPVITCFLESIQQHVVYALDFQLQARLRRIEDRSVGSWSLTEEPNKDIADIHAALSSVSDANFGVGQNATPSSSYAPYNASTPLIAGPSLQGGVQRAGALIDAIPPHIDASILKPRLSRVTSMQMPHRQDITLATPLQPAASSITEDLDNFFDELASLDGADSFDREPQFMQNLGFAPDTNMADFWTSEFNPAPPMSYMAHSSDSHAQLDPVMFGAG